MEFNRVKNIDQRLRPRASRPQSVEHVGIAGWADITDGAVGLYGPAGSVLAQRRHVDAHQTRTVAKEREIRQRTFTHAPQLLEHQENVYPTVSLHHH
jgi:hypothetical protein